MTDGLALVTSVNVAALEGLPHDERKIALGAEWRGFARRTLVDGWSIGCVLRSIKNPMPRGEFGAYIASIGMGRAWAYRLLQVADGYTLDEIVSSDWTLDEAVRALPSARTAAAATPAAAAAPPRPTTAPAPPPVDPEPTPEAVIEAVAVEAEPTAAELRELRLERLFIITENIGDEDGKLVDAWARKFDRQAAREREHVAANRAAAKREQAWKRERADICDALLALPASPGVADVLARFFSVVGKAA